MKMTSIIPLFVACTFSASAFAQSDNVKANDAKAMPGMNMNSMDTKSMDKGDCKPMSNMKGMEMKQMDATHCKAMGSPKDSKVPAHGDMHAADGVVKSIDPQGNVTLQHGPVKSLGWPAMSMGFAVKDKVLMDKLAVGKKVHVEFSKQGDGYVIESVQ